MTLTWLPGLYAICRLASDSDVPIWAEEGSFTSITRSSRELSIVCEQTRVPDGVECDKGWRILMLPGPFDLSQVGILASIAGPLASAGVALFAISTFETDYILVREQDAEKAGNTLRNEGHDVT